MINFVRAPLKPERWITCCVEENQKMPGEFFEIVDWVVYAVSGWRYIFSSSFRQRTHRRWKVEAELTVVFEIVFALAGIALTLLPLWFGIKALMS